MAEPVPAAGRSGPGPERDVLLATKTRVPRPRPGWVSRPRLTARLDAVTGRELVLVCGPAGFGKSSLLADWVRHRPGVAWLSLDAGDNDPVRFWRHVAAALDGARPGLAERVGALLGGAGTLDAAVGALVNELAEVACEVVLVVDDYHLVESPEVHRSLEFLLDHQPGALRLVLAGRTDPPLPLARMRARGQLAELRAADLRFTPAEAAELLRAAAGTELPDAVVSALGERTEGWAAGLQLAALSLRGRDGVDDVAAFVEEFSGSHRYVLDYLAEEVLDRQPDELRTFLLETSVLERLCGPLCDEVTGRTGSQRLLEAIEAANLFVIPLDGTRRWWRYHHLFADLLRARLMQTDPARPPELHRAAAGWYERQALPDDAIRHALAGGAADHAARMVEAHLEDQILRRSERATMTRWIAAVPPEAVHRRPRLALGQAVVALLRCRIDEVEPLLAVAEAAFDPAHDEPYDATVPRTASMLANVPATLAMCRADLARLRGDPENARTFALAALAHVTDEDELLGAVGRYHLAIAHRLAGRLDAAERGLVDAAAERSMSGERHMLLRATFDLGAVQQAQGRLDAAQRTYRRGLHLAERAGPASAGMALVGLAEVSYARDDLDAAREHATAGIDRCRRLAHAAPLVSGLLTLARVRWAEGDRAGARTAVDEAAAVMPAVPGLRTPVPALRASLALAGGDPTEAAELVRDLSPDDEPTYPAEPEYLVLVRLLLADAKPGAALALLDRWHAFAAAQGRTGSIVPLRVLAALAHTAAGDGRAAAGALAEALALAAPEDHLRVFLDEGEALAAPLRALMVGRSLEAVPRGYLTRLAAGFARAGTPILPAARAGAVAVPGLVEPLSARELQVLELVAAGHPNRAIAERLVITLDTVKRHVSHLFGKLGVANRTEAVARARALELLR